MSWTTSPRSWPDLARDCERIQKIVKDLRDFARLDEAELLSVDLNEGIGLTLEIVEPPCKGTRCHATNEP